jgi:diadenosine tetraphosphate (Ap4A) HIT family hydrolase/5-methylcytosine-specific restriction endonuclease McrA
MRGDDPMSHRYKQLSEFIRTKMRMSHVYQPVMLLTLLQNRGTASVTDIAKSLLSRDVSQIEYYEEITKNMVGKVLTRNRGLTEKVGSDFSLKGYAELEPQEIADLVEICNQKIEEYVQRRGERIWSHRKMSAGYISGTIKYQVLVRAKSRCELCGVPNDEKALEVDHIIPRSKHGKDEISNYQALCYSCNAMKRDRDDTDFRGVLESYKLRESKCIFCDMSKSRIVSENALCIAIRDRYPVTDGHMLVIPKRHVSDFFDLYQPERNAAHALLDEQRVAIQGKDKTVSGFNVGVNSGHDAGQTIFHCHIHLIPRRAGDMENPRGGVRGVIPEKRIY